jgi:protoheme IX farnesyltransferase
MKTVTDIAEFEVAIDVPAREQSPSRLRDLYELTKPRMNFLVLCTTAVGFYMAPNAAPAQWLILLHALLGTAMTAASAAVINQLVERDYDALMPRTKDRPLPAGRILPGEALAMGAVLGVVGVAYLALLVNPLTALLGAITLLSYVLVYTPLKRISSLNTVIGAVPGAIPPVMGWTAATDSFGPEAAALFAILFLWQMPHFLAIAILYKRDYAAGGFKMLPVIDGPDLKMTGRMIVLYGLALVPASLIPSLVRMTGAVYFTAAVLLGLAFLSYCVSAALSRHRTDARKLFFASIIYLPVLLAFMMLDKVK